MSKKSDDNSKWVRDKVEEKGMKKEVEKEAKIISNSRKLIEEIYDEYANRRLRNSMRNTYQ